MAIRKGESWGHGRPLSDRQLGTSLRVAKSNAELRRAVADGVQRVELRGGDLFRTLGGSTERLRNDPGEQAQVSVDIVDVWLDGVARGPALAHVIGHDRLFRHWAVAMNADFWRRYQLGPHAHPGDGVVDVYSAHLAIADVLKIAPRARSGTHVPHPAVVLDRAGVVELHLPRRLHFRADDERIGSGQHLRVCVRPDALTVVL